MDYTAAKSAALPKRAYVLEAMRAKAFDIVIIGGGITGAGIALDAATRGLRVALVEKGDYASGTSSKSTKLIHGGLRYLKQLDIGLVREVGLERAAVHKLAPHLVQPEKMLIPIIENGQMGKLTTSLALWVYDFLAGVKGEEKRRMLDREETLAAEPLLDAEIVEGGAVYAEYRTDDARLTLENLKTGAALGALSANYVQVDELLLNEAEMVAGVGVTDLLGGLKFKIYADVVINAAGPWVDFIRQKDHSLEGKRVFHAKGVHFVVPRKRFPVRQSIYFDLPDGRMCFAIPRDRSTYFGTTDTPYTANPDQVAPNQDDLQYLLEGVNKMFPSLHLLPSDIESSWAGLRPLIFEPGKSASEMSRRDEIFESDSGLLSIAGGKLTGYRRMSERIVDKVVARLGRGGNSKTKETALGGNEFADFEEVLDYRQEVRAILRNKQLPERRADYLVHLYGKQVPKVLSFAQAEKVSPELRLAIAELEFCTEYEQVQKLSDFVVRRSGRLYFDKHELDVLLPGLVAAFAKTHHLDNTAQAELLLEMEVLSRQHQEFDEAIAV